MTPKQPSTLYKCVCQAKLTVHDPPLPVLSAREAVDGPDALNGDASEDEDRGAVGVRQGHYDRKRTGRCAPPFRTPRPPPYLRRRRRRLCRGLCGVYVKWPHFRVGFLLTNHSTDPPIPSTRTTVAGACHRVDMFKLHALHERLVKLLYERILGEI